MEDFDTDSFTQWTCGDLLAHLCRARLFCWAITYIGVPVRIQHLSQRSCGAAGSLFSTVQSPWGSKIVFQLLVCICICTLQYFFGLFPYIIWGIFPFLCRQSYHALSIICIVWSEHGFSGQFMKRIGNHTFEYNRFFLCKRTSELAARVWIYIIN